MNFIDILYLIIFLLLWWAYQGYFVYLYMMRRTIKNNNYAYKKLFYSIIVPVYNEKKLIIKKIENLKDIAYKKYEVYFADASDDETSDIIDKKILNIHNFYRVKAKTAGRADQINNALTQAKGDVILITDCDGVMPCNTLELMSEYFRNDNISVVGACVTPQTKNKSDYIFWAMQNRMRLMESLSGHSPVVIGVCYAFRKELIEKLPADVWADDIYVPFMANTKGYNVIYAKDIKAEELRAPLTFWKMLFHKTRKAEDNIRELIRFLPRIFYMPKRWLIIFATRFIQILIMPIGTVLFLVLITKQTLSVLLLSFGIITISAVLQMFIFHKNEIKVNIGDNLKNLLITNIILTVALFRYMFHGGKVKYIKSYS